MTIDRRSAPLDEATLLRSLPLGRAVYGDSEVSDASHMRWKHRQGPEGASHAVHLEADGEIVGRVVLQARRLRVGGEPRRAGYVTDLVLHPDHRGMPHLLGLMREAAAAPGFDLLYVTPSSTSLPLFQSVLGFGPPQPLAVMAAPLRTRSLLRRFGVPGAGVVAPLADGALSLALRASIAASRPHDLELIEEWPSDAELAELDQALARESFCSSPRDAGFLRWRLEPAGREGHRMWCVRRAGRSVGYFATRTCDAEGLRTCFVIDALLLPELDSRFTFAAKLALLGAARETGAEIVLGFFAPENPWLRAFCRLPLLRVPERWLPQSVELFAKPAETSRFFADAYITLADLDVY